MRTFEELKDIYDNLNKDLTHYNSRDDICTPMECVKKMVNYIPEQLWNKESLKALDCCCGNGNFGAYMSLKTNLDNIYFNDLNEVRLNKCKEILKPKNIFNKDIFNITDKFDIIVANPPYSGGGNKNQSLSNKIIQYCITLLNDDGILCFVTPNNWMTYNNNNETLKDLLTFGHFIVIDNDVKKYFPSVGSSFTIFVWQKNKSDEKTLIKNNYLITDEQYVNIPENIPFIPLYCSQEILNIIQKVIGERNIFNYRCDLHNFTQKSKLNDEPTEVFKYKTIHTVKKTRYATIKQDIFDKWTIIIPLSTYFLPYLEHNTNVTQSVGYISFDKEEDANHFLNILNKDWIKVIIHLTRYGNFNNIMVLKHLNFFYDDFSNSEQKVISALIKYIKY